MAGGERGTCVATCTTVICITCWAPLKRKLLAESAPGGGFRGRALQKLIAAERARFFFIQICKLCFTFIYMSYSDFQQSCGNSRTCPCWREQDDNKSPLRSFPCSILPPPQGSQASTNSFLLAAWNLRGHALNPALFHVFFPAVNQHNQHNQHHVRSSHP